MALQQVDAHKLGNHHSPFKGLFSFVTQENLIQSITNTLPVMAFGVFAFSPRR